MFLGIGCADIVPPENAYAERDGNKVIIGCLSSAEKVMLHLPCLWGIDTST